MISQARIPLAAAAALALFALAPCEDSDTIPPPGSSIVISGNPTTVVLGTAPECSNLLQENQCGTAEVVATVSNELGLPLPGQDVRFSSSAGLIFLGSTTAPQFISNLPIATDQFGNARVNLITALTTTVDARSGNATGTLTFNTVAGNLSAITLNNDTTQSGCGSSSTSINFCTDKICVVARALDTSGNGLPGVVMNFNLQNNTVSGNTFDGFFVDAQPVTDEFGDAFTTFTPDSNCDQQCSVSFVGGNGGPCGAEILAFTQGGGFQSSPLPLNISIQ